MDCPLTRRLVAFSRLAFLAASSFCLLLLCMLVAAQTVQGRALSRHSAALSNFLPAQFDPAQESLTRALEKWIVALGDADFETRETASRKLTESGEKAIPFLEKAKKDPDPEVRHRANEILESFRFGILPNTPPALRAVMIELKRQITKEGKRKEIRKLVGTGEIGIKSLERLVRLSRNDEESKNLLEAVIEEFPLIASTFLKKGHGPMVRDFLEAFAGREEEVLPDDYFRFAAGWDWILSEPALGPAALGMPADSRPLLNNPKQPLSLAFGLRTAKKYGEAGKAVVPLKGRDSLRKGFFLESGMWKEAIASLNDGQLDDDEPEYFSMMCTLQHMAGNEKAFDEWYAKYARHRDAGTTHGPEKIPGNLKILFLNDRANEGIAKLKEMQPGNSLFQLLVARLELKEAFALGGIAKEEDAKDLPLDLAIQRARILSNLGKKKLARDLLVALKARVPLGNESPDPINVAGNYLDACQNDPEWMRQTLIGWLEGNHSPDFKAKLFLKATGNDEDKGVGIGMVLAGMIASKETTPEEKNDLIDLFGGKLKAAQAGARLDSVLKALNGTDLKKLPPTRRGAAYLQLAKVAHFYKLAKWRHDILASQTDPDCRLELVDHFLEENLVKPAREIIDALLAANPQAAKNWFALAKADLKEQSAQFPKNMAIALLCGANEIDTLTDQVGAFLEADEKRFGYLLPQFAIATSIPGTYGNGKAYRLASKVFSQRKQYEAAAHALLQSQLRAADPNIYFVTVTANIGAPVNHHRQMLLAALKKGDDEVVKKTSEKILQYLPYDVDLPIALSEHGKSPAAKALLEKYYVQARNHHRLLLQTYPDSGWLRNGIAWMMACCERDLPEAVAHAKKATEVEPTRAGYWDTYGETLFQNGQTTEAIDAITKAIELNAQKTYYQRQKKRFEKGDKTAPRPDEDEGD